MIFFQATKESDNDKEHVAEAVKKIVFILFMSTLEVTR